MNGFEIKKGKPSSFGQIIELALACYADSLHSKSEPGSGECMMLNRDNARTLIP